MCQISLLLPRDKSIEMCEWEEFFFFIKSVTLKHNLCEQKKKMNLELVLVEDEPMLNKI